MAAQPTAAPTTIVENDDDITNLGGDQPIVSPATAPSVTGDTGDFEIIEVDDGGQRLNQPAAEPTLADDARAQNQPQIQQPTEPTGPVREPSRNAIRRQRNKEIAQRNRDDNVVLRREMDAIRAENAQLREHVGRVIEPALGRIDRSMFVERKQQVEGQLGRLESDLSAAQKRIRDAIQANDGDALLAAMESRDEAVIKREQFRQQKAQIDAIEARLPPVNGDARQTQPQTRPAAPQPQPDVRPQLDRNGQRYMAEFSRGLDWFDNDPNTSDPDSRVLQALDAGLVRDGLNPNTQEYWDALEDQAAAYLPQHFAEAETQPQQRAPATPAVRQAQPRQNVQPLRRGPAVASAGDGGAPRQLAKNQVAITPERKAALMEIGALAPDGRVQNPDKLKRVLAQYHEYDRLNAGAR